MGQAAERRRISTMLTARKGLGSTSLLVPPV